MGMAASQARLLSITSRLHDVEYKAQNLQNAKLQLATQEDAAYDEYLKALDQRTLTFASIDSFGNRSDLAATFNNLFSVNAANTATGNFYALIDSRGRVVVSEDVEQEYDGFTHSQGSAQNANLFALYMLYGGDFENEDELFNQIADQVLNEHIETDTRLAELYSAATGRDIDDGRGPVENGNGNNGSGNNGTGGNGNGMGEYDNGTGHGTGTGSQTTGGNTGSTTTTVVGKDDDTPNPVPPKPKPTVLGSITAPAQQKPPQRGGDSGDGGKGADNNGSRGKAVVNTTTTGSGSGTTEETTTYPSQTPNTDINPNSGKIPRTNIEPLDEPLPDEEVPENPDGYQPRDFEPGEVSLQEIYSLGDTEEVQQFLNYFFNKYRTEIFNNIQFQSSDLPNFDYYVRIFNAIQQHGGCISIDDFNGPDGSAADNSAWLTAMLESGQFSLEVFHTDAQGNVTLSGTGVDSDSNLSYTATTQLDKRALAKAEAAYEHAMKIIDRKEKKIDNELSKIEMERNALTKEIDSVSKVRDDNIERTFGIFS